MKEMKEMKKGLKTVTGIIAPTDRELAPFLEKLPVIKTERRHAFEFHTAEQAGFRAVLAVCGVCKVNAAACAQMMADKEGVDEIIVSGVAGAIDETLSIFDMVIAEEVAHHDIEEVITGSFKPWSGSAVFKADKRLTDAVLSANKGEKIRTGLVVTGEVFIRESGREQIIDRFNPLAVDMESAAVAQVCLLNGGIPFTAVRTISDTPKESGFEVFDKNCGRAALISAEAVMRYLSGTAVSITF